MVLKGVSLLSIAVAIVGGVMLPIMFFRELDRREAPPIVIEDLAVDATIVIEVDGAVASPGLVALASGSRWGDAIAAAGGLIPNADRSQINQAARVADGERLLVPTQAVMTVTPSNAEPIPATILPAVEEGTSEPGMVNINVATAAELDALPGIGPVLAERIVDRREMIGRYASVDDLVEVQGISERMLDAIRPLTSV
jgi:competence protein ComEA